MKWISVDDRLPEGMGAHVWVKRSNGDVVKAYYYADKMAWLAWYRVKLSYWWNGNDPLHDVTHWEEKE